MEQVQEVQQAEAAEFARLFCEKRRGLLSFREDGHVLIQRAGDASFKPYRKVRADSSIEEWRRDMDAFIASLPRWCLAVAELPTMDELEEMHSDGVCDTPTGYSVEPDGVGPDGVPSWLRCLGLL